MGLTGALIILSISCFLYLLFFPFSLLLNSRSCFHSRTSFLSYSQLLLHHLLRALWADAAGPSLCPYVLVPFTSGRIADHGTLLCLEHLMPCQDWLCRDGRCGGLGVSERLWLKAGLWKSEH